MAWNVHFGGEKLSAIDDQTYATIKDAIIQAAQSGSAALVGLTTSTDTYELIWTTGAPIYFSYFDEDAETTDLDRELATMLAR